jgi:hypothetical protein
MPTQVYPNGEALATSMQFASAVNAIRHTPGIDIRCPQPTHTMLLVSSTGVSMRRFDYAVICPLKPKGVNKGVSLCPGSRTLKKRAARQAKKSR